MKSLHLLLTLGLLACGAIAQAATYRVGGASQSLTPSSSEWAFDGDYIAGFRGALEDPNNFGPSGVVNRSISTHTLNAVNASTLSGLDMFVGTWIADSEAAPFQSAVRDFFLNGGDLFLLQDDSGHDALGDLLGIATSSSSGSVSNGGAPLFDGPFGVATNVTQHYLVGQLNEAAILARNGKVGGRNAQNQVTSAYWAAGEYAAGAGSLFIIADIDMISTTTACGLPVCGADYDNMNSNAIYALNTFSFLQSQGGNPGDPDNRVPEPAGLLLVSSALGGALLLRRRR